MLVGLGFFVSRCQLVPFAYLFIGRNDGSDRPVLRKSLPQSQFNKKRIGDFEWPSES